MTSSPVLDFDNFWGPIMTLLQLISLLTSKSSKCCPIHFQSPTWLLSFPPHSHHHGPFLVATWRVLKSPKSSPGVLIPFPQHTLLMDITVTLLK